MRWYTKYLNVFEKPLESAPESVIHEIREKLIRFKAPDPLVSVVVIAFNEETRLLSCLWSLSESICNYPMEIIGVNNNSTDRTAEVFATLGINSYNEQKKGPGHARTRGLEEAKGKYYLCIDSDTMYPPYYIQTMIDALKKPDIVAAASLWSFIPDKKRSRIGLKLYEFLRDIHLRLLFIRRPELCVRGMVFGFKTDFGRQAGFNTKIIRGEDGTMALGLKPYGKIKLITNRKARVLTSNSTLNADGSLFKSFLIRLTKTIKSIKTYFTKQTEYTDQESNLLK